MPAPAASNVTLGPMPDLPGGAAPAIQPDGGQPAFDSLLQPAPELRHPATDDGSGQTNSPTSHDNGHDSPHAHAPLGEAPAPPVASNASHKASAVQADSAQNADKPSAAASQADDPAPQEEQLAPDHIIAESLAGLAIQASAPQPAAAPAAAKTNDIDLTAPTPATTPAAIPGNKPRAVQLHLPSRQAAAAQVTAAQRRSRPEESIAETADGSQSAADKPAKDNAVKPGSGQHVDDKNTAGAAIASNVQGNLREMRDAHSSVSLPHERQHDSAGNTAAGALNLDIAAPTVADRGPAPSAAASVTTPEPPAASPAPPANPSNPPPAHTAAIMAPHSRLPAEILAPSPAAPARRSPVEIDSARLLSRVARAFSAAQERDGEIRIRLSPPELGSLRLDVRVQDGALIAQMHTENDAARAAILDNLAALRDRLADQGIRIQRFDVDLMQRQPGGMPDQPGGRQHDLPPALPRGSAATRPRTPAAAASTPVPRSVAASSGGLNVIV